MPTQSPPLLLKPRASKVGVETGVEGAAASTERRPQNPSGTGLTEETDPRLAQVNLFNMPCSICPEQSKNGAKNRKKTPKNNDGKGQKS